jgi:hypothetical protein
VVEAGHGDTGRTGDRRKYHPVQAVSNDEFGTAEFIQFAFDDAIF